ncbi:hypothetical protein Q73_00170 [Bacillus coahuilensis m2-6]|uniref:HD-GYP domain-containing protein n=1 Tax=Bacillus coahuilensis TaxID=408580 RepID=UPI00075040E5|nr:HD domain-containing protein [Bacillus coahuilensis]KUP09992.1 hypothetical protein Q73_00170 [Bacillus coahuilensis m2-6]
MEVRIVLNIMWVAIGIGVVTIIPTSLFFFQTLNVEMIQLISLLCLGYVPYTIFYKSIPAQWQAPLLIVNCIAVISIFYYLAPYMGHAVFYFVPLFGMFFRKVKLFIFSVVVSGIAYIGVLQLVGGPETDWVYFTMNLSFFACYNTILYFLMSVVVSTTTSKVEAEKGIESLILAIEMVDDYTKGHSKRVQEYSLLFGETLKRAGYPVDLDVLSTSSILHDVGKLQIPAAILQKREG